LILSIIIPVYNEAKKISNDIIALSDYLTKYQINS